MPAFSRIMQGKKKVELPNKEEPLPFKPSKDGSAYPVNVLVKRSILSLKGVNFQFCDKTTGDVFWGKVSPKEVWKKGFYLFKDNKCKQPAYRIRPRLGLETGGNTFDAFKLNKKGDLHLGAIRQDKGTLRSGKIWSLLNWEDVILGQFIEEGRIDLKVASIPTIKSLFKERSFRFEVDKKSLGHLYRSLGKNKVEVHAYYKFTPQDDIQRNLLMIVPSLFAAISKR